MKLKLPKPVAWLGFIFLIPSLVLNFFLFQKNQTDPQGILVLEVLDGDTLLLDGKVRLRLRQVDAPELEFCGGQEAKVLLTDLVKNKKVVLKEYILDQYARPMALVYLKDESINLTMIQSGWTRYHSDTTELTTQLKAAANEIKANRIGIYSPDCYQTENLANPGCNIKANIDKNSSKDPKKYYLPDCAQYEFTIIEKDIGENWFCTEKEAQAAGFIKAETCY
ncbi:MAG: thermonuclease family protein [Candidatus Beckwithbacteria bacterium]